VWKRCDGQNTPEDIARLLGSKVNSTIDEKVVWVALDQLAESDLLERSLVLPPSIAGMNRRQLVRTIGLAASCRRTLNHIDRRPTAAQAATCFAPGHACASGPQCCSNVCSSNACV